MPASLVSFIPFSCLESSYCKKGYRFSDLGALGLTAAQHQSYRRTEHRHGRHTRERRYPVAECLYRIWGELATEHSELRLSTE